MMEKVYEYNPHTPAFQTDRTPKEYRGFTLLRDDQKHNFFRIENSPKELDCWYTSINIIKGQIDHYLKRQDIEKTAATND